MGEIYVKKIELDKVNGDMGRLKQAWSPNMRGIGEIKTGENRGDTAEEALEEVPKIMKDVAIDLTELLEVSILFFQNIGLSFDEADNQASEKIKKG